MPPPERTSSSSSLLGGPTQLELPDNNVESSLYQMPLSFVENRGQIDGPVSYYVHVQADEVKGC